jgi:hypothetical protein
MTDAQFGVAITSAEAKSKEVHVTEEVGSVDFVDWISVFTHLRGQQTRRSDRTSRTWDGGLIFVP